MPLMRNRQRFLPARRGFKWGIALQPAIRWSLSRIIVYSNKSLIVGDGCFFRTSDKLTSTFSDNYFRLFCSTCYKLLILFIRLNLYELAAWILHRTLFIYSLGFNLILTSQIYCLRGLNDFPRYWNIKIFVIYSLVIFWNRYGICLLKAVLINI